MNLQMSHVDMRHFIRTAAFLLVTCACASAQTLGDADYPMPSPGARHDQKVEAIKTGYFDLVLIGDSITQTLGDSDGEFAPLRTVWDKYYAPRHALNLGYSGYRTENILWNLQNGELGFAQSPKVAMLLIGTNNTDDQHYRTVHTAEQVFAGTKAIVELIQKRHPTTKILVLNIFPCGGPEDQTPYQRKYNRSAQCIEANRRAGALTAQLADGQNVFWLDIGHVFLRTDGSINTDLMPDLIHPNAAGAEAWAQAVEPTLARLMGDKPIISIAPNTADLETTTPITQNRDHATYNWQKRHKEILDRNKKIKPDVVFFGDSIIHYWGGEPKAPHAWGAQAWSNCFDGVSVENLGFGWDRTENVLWRIEHGELEGITPKIIIIKIGTNNIGRNTPKDIAAGIKVVCDAAHHKQPEAKILLLGILTRRNEKSGLSTTEPVNKLLAAHFDNMDYVTFRDFGALFRNADGTPNTSLFADDVHINAEGYKILGTQIRAEMTRLMK